MMEDVSLRSIRGRNPRGPRRKRGTTNTIPLSLAKAAVGVA